VKTRAIHAFFSILSLLLSAAAQNPAPSIDAVTFVHGSCATDCPVFTLRMERSGLVHYDGKGFVKVYGPKSWSIPEPVAEAILKRLRSGGFAGGRPDRFLTDRGACDQASDGTAATVVLQSNGREEMPIPACYNQALGKIVRDAEAASQASIYTAGHDADREAAIRAVLDAQVVAWNQADIEGFMRGYWMSGDLTFFSGATETKGWKETLERYRRSYKTGGKEMGQLTFDGLRVEMLSTDAAFVRGTWKLTMPDGKTPHGLFTLIFRKMPDGWRIIHDSTGAA